MTQNIKYVKISLWNQTPPSESNRITLPVISSEVRDRLFQTYGLDQTPKDRSIIERITGKPETNPDKLILRDTLEVWGDISRINREAALEVQKLFSATKEGPFVTNSRLAGIAVIFRAYDFQSGNNLLSNFNLLTPSDIALMKEAINSALPKPGDSLLDIALNQPRIPSYHIDLQEVINEIGKQISPNLYGQEFRTGAAIGFGILEKVGRKLLPQQKPPESSPSQEPDLPQP